MIRIDETKCVRCGNCVKDCIVGLIRQKEDKVPFIPEELAKYCINCQHCLAVCPTGALECNGVKPSDCALPGKLPAPGEMLDLLRMRRSVRQYKREDVSPEVLSQLKESLAWTPTGCNDHRLAFRIIESSSQMDFFRKETNAMLTKWIKWGILGFFYPRLKLYLNKILAGEDVIYRNAPHMIVALTPKDAPCKEADPWIALSYFDLLLQSFQLGSCWCGFAVYAIKFNKKLQKHLRIPKGYKVGAVLLFGPPAVTYKRATKPPQFDLE